MKVNEKDEYIIRQKTNSERREIRSILYFFLNRNENDIPTDYNFMENLDYIIISKLEYCIFRVSKKGILEREMIEEVKNIAILLEECFFFDYERKNEKMYINIFEYLLSFKNK